MILWLIAIISFLGLSQSADVRQPPVINEQPQQLHYITSLKNITLECQASGKPEPRITWKLLSGTNGKWEEVVVNNHSIIMDPESGSLTFKNPSSSDAAYYQCFAENKWGTALSLVSYLSHQTLDRVGGSTVTKISVKEGDPARFECYGLTSNPKPIYTWSRAEDVSVPGRKITMTNGFGISDDGDLLIAHVKSTDDDDDKRIFKCTIENAKRDESKSGAYHNLTVTEVRIPTSKKPELMYMTEDKLAIRGRDKTLTCFFSGNPAPNVTWSRSGGLPDNASPDGSKLELSDVDFNDEGEYICTGSNEQGSTQKTLNLTVESVPEWISELYNVEVVEGGTAEFHCKTLAVPEPTVVWMQNGELIDTSNPASKIKVEGSKLTVERVCKLCQDPDLASFQCNSSNVHGYKFSSAYLNVLTQTVMKVLPQDQDLALLRDNETMIELPCDAEGDPIRSLEFSWFKQDRLIDSEQEKALHIDSTTHSLILYLKGYATKEEMYDALIGIYKCQATNEVSTAYAEAEITIRGALAVTTGATFDLWWIFIFLIFFLLLLIILLGCCMFKCNKSDTYLVDKKERAKGNDPVKELADCGFTEYQRADQGPLKRRQASLSGAIKLEFNEQGSQHINGDIDAGTFHEENYFTFQYATNERMNKGAYDSAV